MKIEDLEATTEEYNDQSKEIIKSLSFAKKELSEIDSMKRTEGWQILEKRIREDLHKRILKMVENDAEVVTLLALLHATNTKNLSQKLDEEITSLLPQ